MTGKDLSKENGNGFCFAKGRSRVSLTIILKLEWGFLGRQEYSISNTRIKVRPPSPLLYFSVQATVKRLKSWFDGRS